MDAGLELAGPIETERLVLRPFRESDLDAVLAMQSSPEVARYLYWGPRTEAEALEALGKKIAARAIHADGDALSLAGVLKTTGALVADVVLWLASEQHRLGEIGYIVPPEHRGRGYATEATSPLLHIAFKDLGLHRVIGRVEARNVGSARVLEKAGYCLEGTLRQSVIKNGHVLDQWMYAILRHEVPAGSA